MSRAAKQIAMRLMALESDSEEDDDFTAADDDFHDVSVEVPSTHDDPMGDVIVVKMMSRTLVVMSSQTTLHPLKF